MVFPQYCLGDALVRLSKNQLLTEVFQRWVRRVQGMVHRSCSVGFTGSCSPVEVGPKSLSSLVIRRATRWMESICGCQCKCTRHSHFIRAVQILKAKFAQCILTRTVFSVGSTWTTTRPRSASTCSAGTSRCSGSRGSSSSSASSTSSSASSPSGVEGGVGGEGRGCKSC